VGLAGSSAIITAVMRALMAFYGVEIPKPIQANLILSTETDELKISAGLQDRVIQVYEGAVYMDFSKDIMERQGYGHYEELDPRALPPLFIAYATRLSEGTEVFHNNIRERWDRGEEAVHRVMETCADLAKEARDRIVDNRGAEIGPLMDRNFDQRSSIYRISRTNIELVERARRLGAHAKFAGSGGAAIGTYPDEETYRALEASYAEMDARIFKPILLHAE
jgi:glucuronokinase